MDPIIENNQHPPRSELSNLPRTSIHVQVHELAKLISKIPKDFDLRSSPRGIVVGSFPLEPERSKDLDIEVQGVTWEKLQDYFADKVGFAGITEVTLTRGGENGVIDPSQPGQIGNAFVAVWLTLDGGRTANISIPLRVNSETTRYDLNSVERDPDMPFQDAAKRRNFAHRAVGYDPLGEGRGVIVDPLLGAQKLRQKQLDILEPDSYKQDPLGLYQAVREMASRGMTASPSTDSVLREMARAELPTGPEAIRASRLRHERSLLLCGDAPPSECLRLSLELGVARRDFLGIADLYDQLHSVHMGASWDQALAEVDRAWTTAREQSTWTIAERFQLVATHLGYELQTLARKVESSLNVPEALIPFIPGEESQANLTLSEIAQRIERLSTDDFPEK